jgi:hypothetical protein
MATIEDAIYARLQAVSAVTSLVSTRIYPIKKDEGTKVVWPFVTYATTYASPVVAMGDDPGMMSSEVRFHIWAQGSGAFDSAIAIKQAIRTALQRWRGTAGGITVNARFLEGDFDIEDAEPGVFHRILDFDFRWYE